jgi:hypothetical protein
MQRREFITLVGGAATWPVLARGQQGGKVPTIGFLGATTPLLQRSDTTAKRIELLHEIIPGLRRLALLVHSGSASNTLEAVEVQVTAEKLGLEIANH